MHMKTTFLYSKHLKNLQCKLQNLQEQSKLNCIVSRTRKKNYQNICVYYVQ